MVQKVARIDGGESQHSCRPRFHQFHHSGRTGSQPVEAADDGVGRAYRLCVDYLYLGQRSEPESTRPLRYCRILRKYPPNKRLIFKGEHLYEAKNINGYLLDGENVFVGSRSKPLCDVPEMGIGNKPIDGGFYLFTDKEKEYIVKKEPAAERYFRHWYDAKGFINRRPYWCLWLGDTNPVELLRLPECMKRINAVRDFRLKSKRSSTVKLADQPTHFQVENMPKGNYLLVPETSSERRQYIPIGFMSSDMLPPQRMGVYCRWAAEERLSDERQIVALLVPTLPKISR